MLKDKRSIPTPPKGGIIIFRSIEDGAVYYKADNGSIVQVESYHGVYRIQNPKFKSYNVLSDERLVVLTSLTSQFIFALYRATMALGGGRSGGGGGIRGLIIEDEDVPFNGTFTTLNFEGAGVIVTDDGSGKATVTIGGGGMIFGVGTPDRLAMFTAPNTIGDSPFLRSGSDVIADGDMYFSTGNGIDVVATGGADVLSIGTANADIINYGYSGTTHNFEGATFNASTTNLNVEDKLITINDGGGAGTGGSAGFEIEEAGAATGYFIQNAGRTGFDFKASSNASVVTLSFIGVAANQTMTVQNASGTIAYLSDITSLNAFVQGGNSFAANARLGTNDNFPLEFEINNILAASINTSRQFLLGNPSATNGSLVFNNSTNANTLTINSGVTSASHSWTLPLAQGAASTVLTNNGSGVLSWTAPSSVAWMLDGNTVGAEKWIGTIDAFAFPIRTNNTEKARILTTGEFGIGTTTPGFRLTVEENGDAFINIASFRNTSAGTSAIGAIGVSNGTTAIKLFNGGVNLASGLYGSAGGAGLVMDTNGSAGHMNFINANTNMRFDFYAGDYVNTFSGRPTMTIGAAAGVLGVGINMAPASVEAKLHVRGATADNTAFNMKLVNSTPAILFSVRNDGRIAAPLLQTGNAGLAAGDLYVDTAANIAANADLIVARKV